MLASGQQTQAATEAQRTLDKFQKLNDQIKVGSEIFNPCKQISLF